MANILSLAMKITADASGLPASLTPVEKALANLGKQADAVSGLFDQFASSTSGAASAQQNVQSQLDALTASLKAGEISAQDYAAGFAAIQQSAQDTVRVFQEGAATTARFATEQDKASQKVADLASQLKLGAVEGPTFERALSAIAGVDLSSTAEGRDLIERLAASAKAGGLDAQVAAKDLLSLGDSGKQLGTSLEQPKLKLNELSGVFAALPGPIGEIAGRFSGLVSAGEGLGRVFAGGLTSGISSFGSSIAALVNPFTLAAAGIAAFGAAATAITSGLGQLAGKVEDLSNKAVQLGTSFDFVQVLDEAAARTGISIDTLAGAMQKFAGRVDDARSGSGKAAEAFRELVISQEELISSNPVDIATRTAEALLKIEDPARRASLATDTLGKSGLELVPAFASLDDARDTMERFSTAISDIDVTRLESLDNSFDNVSAALKGLGQELLLPFTGLADGVASAIADAIGGLTKLIAPVLDAISPILDGVGEGFRVLGQAIFTVADTAGTALQAFSDTVGRVATIVSTAIQKTLGFVTDLASKFLEYTGIGDTLTSVTDTIANAFQGLWDGIKNVIGTIGGFIDQVLQFAEDWLGIKSDIEDPVAAELTFDTEQAEQASEAFQKSLDDIAKTVDKAKNESVKFGQAGFDAAVTYEQAVQELREQLEAGILNETSFKMAVEDVTESYEEQISSIQRNAEESKQRAEAEAAAAKKILEDNRKIADALLEQLRIQEEFGGDTGRAKAAENVKAIEQEILRVEKELQSARADGDKAGADAATARLAKLDQVLAQEQDIASGAAAERERERERAEDALKEQDRLAEERQKNEDEIRKLIEKNAEEIAAKQEELINRVYDLERDRIEEINRLRGGGIEVGDIRSNDGADTFLDLLGGKQDEAIAEYRKSVKELQALRKDIQKLQAQRVEILGGVG